MAGPLEFVTLPPESNTLSPLPLSHYRGLTAVAVIACISFASTTTLFFHLTYKLIRWHIRTRRTPDDEASHNADLSLGLDQRHFTSSATDPEQAHGRPSRKRPQPNQFVVLIFNLLLADMHQAMAFLLNAVWVSRDGVFVKSGTCWAQGWFVSSGDLSSSCFISAIAVHTYMTVVRGYKPPHWALTTAIVCIWIFVYGVSIAGIASTSNGSAEGGYYVRAAAWCWINESFETIRLTTHYLFIFISLALTSVLYTLIFLTLRSRSSSSVNPTPSQPDQKMSTDSRQPTAAPAPTTASGHHPAFLAYPIIYVLCTSPLAVGRIATMAGANVPVEYFCAAGALIVSNGWLDVLLWGTTRRMVIFGAVDNEDALGLDSFTFIRTPANRKYGNMVWVQGASDGDVLDGGAGDRKPSFWNRMGIGRRSMGREIPLRHGGKRKLGQRSLSQESLRGTSGRDMGLAIQMDRTTTVVVEIDGKGNGRRHGESSTNSAHHSSEEAFRHGI